MFGWFAAKCPLGTYEKTWTESRMRWLADQFGIERLLRAKVILPTDEFFPDTFDGSAEDAQRMLVRLCGYLEINPQKVQLEICPDEQLPGAAGQYHQGERSIIRVVQSQLADPQSLVATLAHELAHELLLGGGLLSADAPDHEWVTDLLPVFLGLGIFAANSTVHDSSQTTGTMHSWRIRKQGYLPSQMFGYALALFALMRHEKNPAWAKYLRLDAISALRAGMRYVDETDDSLFHPDTIRRQCLRMPPTELATRLRTGTASVRLATLWEISRDSVTDKCAVTAVTECLANRDRAISAAAGATLAALGPAAAPALPQLVAALSAHHEDTRAGAARALGVLALDPETVIPELAPLVQEDNDAVAIEAAIALRRFDRRAEPATPQVLTALANALIDCRFSLVSMLAATLCVITDNPDARAREFFSDYDSELGDRALAAIDEQQAQTSDRSSIARRDTTLSRPLS